MPPSRDKTEPQDVEFVLHAEGRDILLRPGEKSTQLDDLLDERGAETCVFLPLVRPDRLGKKRLGCLPPRDPEKQRKKLPEADWHDGSLTTTGPQPKSVPGVFALDLRRYNGRLAVHNLGLPHFYWGARGAAVEVHEASPLDDDSEFEMSSMQAAAGRGLRDLSRAVLDFDRLPGILRDAGADVRNLVIVASLLIGLSLMFVGLASTGALAEADGSESGRLTRLVGILGHPVLLPTILLGLYLRSILGGSPSGMQRELTKAEAEAGWRRMSPLFACVWIVCLVGVLVLSLARIRRSGAVELVELVDDTSRYVIFAFWILTPVTYGRDLGSVIGSSLEAVLAAIVAVFVMKISLVVTNLITSTFWSVLAMFLPFTIPIPFQDFFNVMASVGAELFFLGLLSGYTWIKTREHFGRWATVTC